MRRPRGETSLEVPASLAPPPVNAATAEDNALVICELIALGTSHIGLFAVSGDKQHGIFYDMTWADRWRERGKLCIGPRLKYTPPVGSNAETGAVGDKPLSRYKVQYHVKLLDSMTVGELTQSSWTATCTIMSSTKLTAAATGS